MKTNLNLVIYNNKRDLSDSADTIDIQNPDLILLHQTYATSNQVQQLDQLSKGVLAPSQLNSSYPNKFLAQLHGCKKPITIATPLVDNVAHSPYYNILNKIEELEVTISQNFLAGEHYSNYSLFERMFELYQFSFQYAFQYLEQQILQRSFLQSIGAWQQSEKSTIDALTIGNHNFVTYRLMCNPESKIKVQTTSLTNNFVSFSIRHEIMRRRLLNMPISEQHYNGFTIERAIRLLQTEITLPPNRQTIYTRRDNLCQLSDSCAINLSTQVGSMTNAQQKLNFLLPSSV